MVTESGHGMTDKVYIGRKSRYTGRVEFKDTKCGESWCGEVWVKNYPDRVWKFSKSGAKKIIQRYESYGWNWDYFVVPVDEFEG